ncbi:MULTISPECIES: hypothetical protein [Alcanivoracaceae]|uniref:Lipoprotein n=2 Tax=Alcanivoracaceae TaxID=224372 RepID=A0ABQ6Y7G3_9GAMM|nr:MULTISPECIES: hypothetical protein [Alcanivoracaceae]ARB45472.1 hypothetical protein P40_08625 [Alloalcanivorax xenomutans]KAF0805398.1 lipoprotein [Alcanivorax xiamenensis]MCE7523603.1 hypothetical protein [Alloalcanivorax xenomutans]WOA33183.1 hypothetical protein RVY87_08860 [Alloalcanivorax xenomutans]
MGSTMPPLKILALLCGVLVLTACDPGSVDEQLSQLDAEQKRYQERLAEVPDDTVREQLSRLVDTAFWMRRAELRQSLPPATPEYASPSLAILADYRSPQAMADNYVRGLLIEHNPRLMPERTQIVLPFDYPFEHALSWTAATLSDGTRLTPTASRPGMIDRPAIYQERRSGLRTVMPGNQEAPPVAMLQGRLALTVPRGVEHLAFEANQQGESRTVGDIEVTLVSVDHHQATVAVKTDADSAFPGGDSVILNARDDSGRTLATLGVNTGPPGLEAAMLDLLDATIDDAIDGNGIDPESVKSRVEARQQALREEHGDTSYHQATFAGPIAELEVLLVGVNGYQHREETLTLTPVQFQAATNTPTPIAIPTTATVYDPTLRRFDETRPWEWPPDRLSRIITVSLVGLGEVAGHQGTPASVRFHYPSVPSDHFISAFDRFEKLIEVAFLDSEGELIPLPDEQDQREQWFRFTVNRLEYHPQAFPTPPARVRGRLLINQRPEIQSRWVRAQALPEGARLLDNMFVTAPSHDNRQLLVLAQDDSGRYLKHLATVGYHYHRDQSRPPQWAHHFYGTPERLLLVRPGREQQVEYHFDVALKQ